MGCPGSGPCQIWDLDLSCCLVSGGFQDPCLIDNTPTPPEIIDASILAASEFMYAATGRQFGLCTVTLRPLCINECPNDCTGLSDSGYGFPWMPLHQKDGSWVNVTCSESNCTCVDLCSVPLPFPICSIDKVVIDGEIVPDTEYSVINFNKLIRTRADGCWPRCNTLSLPDSEEGTWSVTVTYGRPPPQLVLLATAELSCNFIKQCLGRPCDLPKRIQTLNRQGVSATFLDPMEFMRDGMTGIFLVDLAIKTYNPHKLFRKPWVGSPDSINKWAIITSPPVSGGGP